MKKKFFTLISALIIGGSLSAETIETFPYTADWKYADESNIGSNTGKPTDDQSLYNLGGWTSIAGQGDKPFYIAFSKGAPLSNTMEFVDGQQTSIKISYLVSPVFNFSDEATSQIISFKCGKENTAISNLELLYTTNYTGDVNTTEWTPIKANLIPEDQSGLGDSKLTTISVTTNITSPTVVLAIRAAKDDNYSGDTSAQTKIRVTKFQISLEEKELIESIPYEAKWNYKPELINAADSTFIDQENYSEIIKESSNWEFNGWASYREAKSRDFSILTNKNDKGLYRQIPNTVEWTDNCKNNPGTINWFISPKIDLSAGGTKYIQFYTGKEAADQLYSNIELLYSLDYKDDYQTATWISIKKNIIPAEQAGLDNTTMVNVNEPLNLVANSVTFAFKAAPQENGTVGAKQTKIRIKDFKILDEDTTTSIENTKANDTSVNIYPNPTQGILNVSADQAITNIIITNIGGQTIMQIAQPAGQISIANLPTGYYQALIILSDGSQVVKRIVKR